MYLEVYWRNKHYYKFTSNYVESAYSWVSNEHLKLDFLMNTFKFFESLEFK